MIRHAILILTSPQRRIGTNLVRSSTIQRVDEPDEGISQTLARVLVTRVSLNPSLTLVEYAL